MARELQWLLTLNTLLGLVNHVKLAAKCSAEICLSKMLTLIPHGTKFIHSTSNPTCLDRFPFASVTWDLHGHPNEAVLLP